MTMWKFKSCPRCGGDLFIDRGIDGWYQQCLQCSYRRELKSLTEFREQPVPGGRELAGAGGTRSQKENTGKRQNV